MKTLCFALILSQNAADEAAPPAHIQDLMKKRILYQIKQQNPDLQFFFDESTCNVIGSYEYVDEALIIQSPDRSLDLQYSYTDILEGKKLELSQISQALETKANVLAAGNAPNYFSTDSLASSQNVPTTSSLKKWVPWIIGSVVLGIGAWAAYNSVNRGGGGDSGPSEPARRRR